MPWVPSTCCCNSSLHAQHAPIKRWMPRYFNKLIHINLEFVTRSGHFCFKALGHFFTQIIRTSLWDGTQYQIFFKMSRPFFLSLSREHARHPHAWHAPSHQGPQRTQIPWMLGYKTEAFSHHQEGSQSLWAKEWFDGFLR